MVLVGPSGCGKSTALRMIAGLEDLTGGTIAIGGRRVDELPPKDRDVAMVFQNYALYPHMTIRENLEFGLKMRKVPREEMDRLVAQAAATLELAPLLDRRPRQLSGGQRQRVALGRAIVRQPAVYLFDEPLSNLDAKLRLQMRAEIKNLQRRLKTTTVYVTHDQVEAMTMGTRIAVMKDGRLQQVGTPLDVYDRPANLFVALFIGSPPMSVIEATVRDGGARVEANGLELPVPEHPSGRRAAPRRPVRPRRHPPRARRRPLLPGARPDRDPPGGRRARRAPRGRGRRPCPRGRAPPDLPGRAPPDARGGSPGGGRRRARASPPLRRGDRRPPRLTVRPPGRPPHEFPHPFPKPRNLGPGPSYWLAREAKKTALAKFLALESHPRRTPGMRTKKTLSNLSRRERQIMDVLYRDGQATAGEVLAALPDAPGYSAVRALLRILENKGHIRHVSEGTRYVYLPTLPAGPSRTAGARQRDRDLLRRLDGKSRRRAPRHLEDRAVGRPARPALAAHRSGPHGGTLT